MNALEPSCDPVATPWTCPFCPLLCDSFSVDAEAGGWALRGSECARARAGLARFGPVGAPVASPLVDGVACDMKTAIAAAARRLAASRQPLFGGLGTDVAGARALYPLACRTGAIGDPVGGASWLHGLRALQDRGGFTTTLAEVRTRADLIVCVGSMPNARFPEFLRRCGFGEAGAAAVVLLQPTAAPSAEARVEGVELVRFEGDLFDAASMLAACVAGRAVGAAGDALAPLAARLHAARYAVLAYETAQLPAQGALIVEAVNRAVGTLNQRSRAAALPLGGGDGAATVNAVFTWLSGLPLRTRAAPGGLEHEPLRFDARRLLADGAVDLLLWIASYGTEPAAPATDVPRIVLGHPHFATGVPVKDTVFIPVSTPGIGSRGHLFRTDGSVLMPLRALRDDGLPRVDEVLRRLTQALDGATA
ncbi:MAG TPA: formylmethanofuran dehydrogenase [Burkholderiaceae bacterium]|jgi:formylmethanofuran dehydrogenase subunit B